MNSRFSKKIAFVLALVMIMTSYPSNTYSVFAAQGINALNKTLAFSEDSGPDFNKDGETPSSGDDEVPDGEDDDSDAPPEETHEPDNGDNDEKEPDETEPPEPGDNDGNGSDDNNNSNDNDKEEPGTGNGGGSRPGTNPGVDDSGQGSDPDYGNDDSEIEMLKEELRTMMAGSLNDYTYIDEFARRLDLLSSSEIEEFYYYISSNYGLIDAYASAIKASVDTELAQIEESSWDGDYKPPSIRNFERLADSLDVSIGDRISNNTVSAETVPAKNYNGGFLETSAGVQAKVDKNSQGFKEVSRELQYGENEDYRIKLTESVTPVQSAFRTYLMQLQLEIEELHNEERLPADIVFVLDTSASMAWSMDGIDKYNASYDEQRINYAKVAIASILNKALYEDGLNRVGVVVYNDYADVLIDLDDFNGSNKADLIEQVLAYDGLGGLSNAQAGMVQAQEMLAGSGNEHEQYIIVLSDGGVNVMDEPERWQQFFDNSWPVELFARYESMYDSGMDGLSTAQSVAVLEGQYAGAAGISVYALYCSGDVYEMTPAQTVLEKMTYKMADVDADTATNTIGPGNSSTAYMEVPVNDRLIQVQAAGRLIETLKETIVFEKGINILLSGGVNNAFKPYTPAVEDGDEVDSATAPARIGFEDIFTADNLSYDYTYYQYDEDNGSQTYFALNSDIPGNMPVNGQSLVWGSEKALRPGIYTIELLLEAREELDEGRKEVPVCDMSLFVSEGDTALAFADTIGNAEQLSVDVPPAFTVMLHPVSKGFMEMGETLVPIAYAGEKEQISAIIEEYDPADYDAPEAWAFKAPYKYRFTNGTTTVLNGGEAATTYVSVVPGASVYEVTVTDANGHEAVKRLNTAGVERRLDIVVNVDKPNEALEGEMFNIMGAYDSDNGLNQFHYPGLLEEADILEPVALRMPYDAENIKISGYVPHGWEISGINSEDDLEALVELEEAVAEVMAKAPDGVETWFDGTDYEALAAFFASDDYYSIDLFSTEVNKLLEIKAEVEITKTDRKWFASSSGKQQYISVNIDYKYYKDEISQETLVATTTGTDAHRIKVPYGTEITIEGSKNWINELLIESQMPDDYQAIAISEVASVKPETKEVLASVKDNDTTLYYTVDIVYLK